MICICTSCWYEWDTTDLEEPCPSCGEGGIEESDESTDLVSPEFDTFVGDEDD
jgi:predicted RNA-binding Zn-ribbon protein involved in translation (DUF1610 family)